MWQLKNLISHCSEVFVHIPDKDIWVPARPVNYKDRSFVEKIKEAWAVFTGKADVFKWPEGQ